MNFEDIHKNTFDANKNNIMSKDEIIRISFMGMKFECTNPSNKAIIITVLLLIFFLTSILVLR